MSKISRHALSTAEIKVQLGDIPGWSFKRDKLVKSFKFKNFRDALAFIVRLGLEAEGMNHHPEIKNVYNQVGLALNTHDAGGRVTALDIELARRIEKIPVLGG